MNIRVVYFQQPEPVAGKRGKGAMAEERPSKKFKDMSGTSKATQASSSVASPLSRSKSKLPQVGKQIGTCIIFR